MAKDINIHLKTTGAAQTKQQLEEVGQASKQVGDHTAAGHKQGADAVDKTTQKMTGMGRILGSLKGQIAGFVGAWLGLQGVQRIIGYVIEKLERIQRLQKEIYQRSVDLADIGQALEFQTGTRGMQQYWVQQAIQLQQAGALASPVIAQQMMVSMDIAFARQGGIRNRQIMELATQLAPFVGAARLGPEEVAKVFEFAGVAGIAPTAPAYKEYLAKLQAGYTASKAVDFGQFMMGLQKGGTAYMAMGGTLEEAISSFAAARAVMANEALAATLVEQVARLSGGAYEKPRLAIERGVGVKWSELSMDQRTAALLRYVGGIPEARRGEVLAKEGFPVELTTQIGKMVSSEAMRTMAVTREQVAGATAQMVDDMMQAYLNSMLARQREAQAQIAGKEFAIGPEYADWQTRLREAEAEAKLQASRGKVREAFHPVATYIIAFEQLLKDVEDFAESLPEGPARSRAERLAKDIQFSLTRIIEDPIWAKFAQAGPRLGEKYVQSLKQLQEGVGQQTAPIPEVPQSKLQPVEPELPSEQLEPETEPVAKMPPRSPRELTETTPISPTAVSVSHYYDNSMRFYPVVGDDERGPRFTQVG